MREVAEIRPAPTPGDRDSEQALRSELAPETRRELVAAIDVGRERRDARLREPAHRLTHLSGRLTLDGIDRECFQPGHTLPPTLMMVGLSDNTIDPCKRVEPRCKV